MYLFKPHYFEVVLFPGLILNYFQFCCFLVCCGLLWFAGPKAGLSVVCWFADVLLLMLFVATSGSIIDQKKADVIIFLIIIGIYIYYTYLYRHRKEVKKAKQ
jgi:hypothetical protein